MRLWTLHPKYLDPQGLVALWREALLAQRVLRGETRGYRNHPQLHRFRASADPLGAIGSYLLGVHAEACVRGYAFNASLISTARGHPPIPTTEGQLRYEAGHLRAKLASRNPPWLHALDLRRLEAHPLFQIVPGAREPWERGPERGDELRAGRSAE